MALDLQKVIDQSVQENAPQSIANSQTPKQAAFSVDIPETIDASVLDDGVGVQDVLKKRDRLATPQVDPLADFDQEITPVTPFSDPDAFLESALAGDREETDVERRIARERRGLTQATEGIAATIDVARERAEETTQFSEREQLLAETNEDIARRQTQFRRELRAFQEDSERRGVARGSFEDERAKLTANAKAELADLYIIQNAQQGNVDAAREYINTAVENRYRNIQLELQERQARLNELIPTLEKEEKERALKLQLALGERERNLETEKEEARAKRELMLTVAKNGGGKAVQRAVVNAASVDDAIIAASPYIGLLERQAAARAASNAALARRNTLIELAMKGDQDAIKELGTYGEHLSSILNDEGSVQREQQFNDAAEKVNLAQRIKQNELGLNLNTGAVKSPYLAAGTTLLSSMAAGLGMGGPIGGAVGLGVGGAGAAYVVSQGVQAKEDFLADIKSLVAPEALDELVRQKQAGATFGALSNAELGLLLASSQELAGHVNINDRTGEVSLIGSPQAIQSDLDKVIAFYEKAQRGMNEQEIDNTEASQINRLFE